MLLDRWREHRLRLGLLGTGTETCQQAAGGKAHDANIPSVLSHFRIHRTPERIRTQYVAERVGLSGTGQARELYLVAIVLQHEWYTVWAAIVREVRQASYTVRQLVESRFPDDLILLARLVPPHARDPCRIHHRVDGRIWVRVPEIAAVRASVYDVHGIVGIPVGDVVW